MTSTILFAVMSPTAAVIAAITVFSYYRSGMKQVNEYEALLKEMRIQVIKGNLGHEKFRYMKENLKVEEIFVEESKRLDEMFQQGLMDELTYTRMKNVLQLTFNKKLVNIHTKYYD
jgi:hypothetical protein